MDYVDSPEEQAKNPKARKWLEYVANGDASALEFCWALWNFEHMLDDLVDEPGTVMQDAVARETLRIFATLSFNRFYNDFKGQLFGLIVSCFNRWVEADALKAEGKSPEMTQVVRCGELDLFCAVAFLVGGWEHMRMCRYLREFDRDDT